MDMSYGHGMDRGAFSNRYRALNYWFGSDGTDLADNL